MNSEVGVGDRNYRGKWFVNFVGWIAMGIMNRYILSNPIGPLVVEQKIELAHNITLKNIKSNSYYQSKCRE